MPVRMCRLISRACSWFHQQHEQFFHRTGDPAGLVDHQGVAGLEHGEGLAQLEPVGAGAGGLDDDLAAVRGGQRVQLQ